MAKKEELDNEELENEDIELEEDLEEDAEDLEDDRGDSFEGDDDDELEDEDTELSEEGGGEDTEELEEEPKEAIRIPKERLDEVIGQREYEREQNEALRKQNEELISILKEGQGKKEEKKVPAFDFEDAEEKYMEAVLEGEVKEAQAIRATIRKAERNAFLEEAKGLRDEAVNSAREEAGRLDDETKFTRAVRQSEETYPFLDNRHAEYNQGAVDEVNELYMTFVKANLTKTAAIKKAVDLVSPKYETDKPKIGEPEKGGRRKKALKKNSSAQNRQPAKMKGRGARDRDLDEFDVKRMTDSQFSKLSKREISELRGDNI